MRTNYHSPDWLSRIRSWRSPYSTREVKTARQSVAHLEPAVVVTGGSRGIGFALAQRFLEAGHCTAIVARNAAELLDATKKLSLLARKQPTSIVCDVTSSDAPAVIVAELERSGLYLDILVNNAGIGLSGPFLTHSDEELARLISLNVTCVTRLTHWALPGMLLRQRGGILNVASLGASVPGPNQAAYYASKAYVLSLTEAIASEVSGQGVRIAAVLPGPVETSFHADMGAEASLYRLMLPSLSPDRVARSAYRGFMLRRRVIIPGLFNNAMYLALKLLPHAVTVPLVSLLLKRAESLSSR